MSLTEPPRLDLDAEIVRVEQRLMRREQRLRARAASLSAQVKRQWRPRRLLINVAGAVLGSAAVLSLLRGRRHAVPPPAAGPAAAPTAGFAWAPWVGLAWPMLPARWRRQVSPSMAVSVLSLGLPVLLRLLGRKPRPPG